MTPSTCWVPSGAEAICIGFAIQKRSFFCPPPLIRKRSTLRRRAGVLSAKSSALLCAIAGTAVGVAAVRTPSVEQEAVPFAPRSYVCYRAPSQLNIDGKLDEAVWASAAWSDAFVDIEGDRRPRP